MSRPAGYRFLTTWLVGAPRRRVWDVLQDPLAWPEWWRGVRRVSELEPGGPERVGASYRIAWRSRIPYDLEFDFRVLRLKGPLFMEGSATGQLEGMGRWRLFEDEGVTAVLYEWDVQTNRAWMNLLAPLARAAFVRNHNTVMRWGGEGLARRLGADLLAVG